MLHTFYLNDPWFDYVKSGEKKYEGRRKTETMKLLKVNDTIRFIHYTLPDLTPPFYKNIEEILEFETFEKAMEALTIPKVLPIPGLNMPDACEIYQKYVSLNTQINDGVIMFKLKSI